MFNGKGLMRPIHAAFAISLALALPLAPAAAQSGRFSVGMQVTDAQGRPVGTVAAVKGDNLLLRTDKHEALFPLTSFTPAQGKLLFGMTAAQVNAEIEKSLAAAQSAVVAGATVKGTGGAAVGTLAAVDAETATITLASGKSIRVQRSGIRGNPDGTVLIGLTAAQLEAQVQATASAAVPAADGKPATSK